MTSEIQPLAWADLAYAFLKRYAYQQFGRTFTAEELVDAANAWKMMEPENTKQWGLVIRKAAHNGIISQVGYGIAKRRHGSPTPLWRSNVC